MRRSCDLSLAAPVAPATLRYRWPGAYRRLHVFL